MRRLLRGSLALTLLFVLVTAGCSGEKDRNINSSRERPRPAEPQR
jgi:hypothetical protein